MNTLVTTTLHPQTAASASAVVVTVEQPQTTSKQGFNVVQQNQTPVVQLMTHLPQQAPQVIEDDNTPVKGMFLGLARKPRCSRINRNPNFIAQDFLQFSSFIHEGETYISTKI